MILSGGVRQRLEFAAKCFIWCSFLGSLVVGGLRLRANALAAPAHVADLSRWRVAARPAWSTPDDIAAVREAAALDGTVVPLRDRAALSGIRSALAAAPMVRRVLSVRRRAPDRVLAALELRRPALGVLQPRPGARYLEVDDDGVVLRRGLDAPPSRSARPLPIVVGATTGAGTDDVLGSDVRAAAALVARLARAATAARDAAAPTVARIDVSNFAGRRSPLEPEVVLWIRGASGAIACPIEWGRVEGFHTDAAEPGFGAKRRLLQRALDRHPGLTGLAVVKVAFRELVVVPHAREPVGPDGGRFPGGARDADSR